MIVWMSFAIETVVGSVDRSQCRPGGEGYAPGCACSEGAA